jgi:hypothetical protein
VSFEAGRFLRRILDFGTMERRRLFENIVSLYTEDYIVGGPKVDAESKGTKAINGILGFIDGAFDAVSTVYCRDKLLDSIEVIEFLQDSAKIDDLDNSIYWGMRLVKLFHPTAYHCYYATK